MTPGVSPAARVRAYLTGVVITCGLLGVAVRAWALQVDEGERYRAIADRQHAMSLQIPAPRGEVLDVRGRSLAVSADTESIWANPRDVRDVAATAERIAALVGGDPSTLEAKLAGDHKFVWIDRHVTPAVAKRVREAKLPGIEIATEPRRWYPARSLAAAVIGRADIDGNGLDGVEYAMNALLSGRRGAVAALRDARGRTMFADGLAEAEPGASVHLSLDLGVQHIAEDALETAVQTNHAKSGVVVVLEVSTGRVLAMASYPSFDPNSGDARGARNRAVTDAFEAGSVMKVFSVASALDAGVVTPETEFEIGDQLMVGARPIHDTHFDAYLTVSGIIKRSSNIGAAKIALRLGAAKLHDGLVRFGFGEKSGIELPGEQAGMLREPTRWRDIDLAHMAFGYGLTVTPVQVAAALAAVGNRGVYHPPRIVDEVVDDDGTVLYHTDVAERRVIEERTAAQMMAMLASVFDKKPTAGTASELEVAGFRCAGKTGTAHKYDPDTHAYALDRYLSSFAGLAPAEHPRLAIVAMVDEPAGDDYYGGKVAGPVFAKVASEALRYLGVPGSSAAAPATAPPPAPALKLEGSAEFIGLGFARAIELAREKHVTIEVVGSGRVASQETLANGRIRLRLTADR
jgi:cell division protein FtsI (penicillin-binding protein 3)